MEITTTDLDFAGAYETIDIILVNPKILEYTSLFLSGRNSGEISLLFLRNVPVSVILPINHFAKSILEYQLLLVRFFSLPFISSIRR